MNINLLCERVLYTTIFAVIQPTYTTFVTLCDTDRNFPHVNMQQKCQNTESLVYHLDIIMRTGRSVVVRMY